MRTKSTRWLIISAITLIMGFGIQCHSTSNLSQAQNKKEGAGNKSAASSHLQGINTSQIDWKKKTKEYWQKVLTSSQYRVCRQGGTERAFTGQHLYNKKTGYFTCSSCGHILFQSQTKFKSGTGWPSFYQPYQKDSVKLNVDRSYGMVRTEVVCGRCGAHLGHVFNDGPKPTRKRYCINSVCLNFQSSLLGTQTKKLTKEAKKNETKKK